MNIHFRSRILLSLCLLCSFFAAHASHIVGGEVTYAYLGDSGIYSKYRISISIYEDCQNGQPAAIAQDNPAYVGIYGASDNPFITDSIFYSSSISVPSSINTACGSSAAPLVTCLIKKTFIKTYALPANTTGYLVSYQRCCRNASIANIVDPGDNGCTYACTIPPSPTTNNSAVFRNYPPQTICLGLPLAYDNSATDADGDSLSYGFQAALNCCGSSDVKPDPPLDAPFDSVVYISPFTSTAPMSGSPAIVIDPVTGMITGTPSKLGRYLVTVYCHEWRGGTLVNTISREFQFVTTDCGATTYHPYAGRDTTILEGDSIHFAATDGASFTWSPGTYLTSTTIADPVGHFPVAGHFAYTVHAISDSGCVGTDIINVTVLPYWQFIVPTGFSPSDGSYLRPIPMNNVTLISFKIFNRKGNMVYSGGPGDPGWDGTYKGTKQDIGTYFWELAYIDNNGKNRREKGDVTLIR